MPIDAAIEPAAGPYRPWVMLDVPANEGKTLRLIDFASAGATGSGRVLAERPRRAAAPAGRVAAGRRREDRARHIRITSRPPAVNDRKERRHTVIISDSPSFEHVVLRMATTPARG